MHNIVIFIRLWIVLTGSLCSSFSPTYANSVLNFSVSNVNPLVGDLITTEVLISDTTDLFAYNLDIIFDHAILNVDSVEAGAFLSNGGLTLGAIGLFGSGNTSTPGEIQDINDSLLGPVPGVSGTGVLAIIAFNVVGAGTSSVAFGNVSAPGGTELIDSVGQSITISSAPDLTITAIPAPESGLLFIFGLGALVVTVLNGRRGTQNVAASS